MAQPIADSKWKQGKDRMLNGVTGLFRGLEDEFIQFHQRIDHFKSTKADFEDLKLIKTRVDNLEATFNSRMDDFEKRLLKEKEERVKLSVQESAKRVLHRQKPNSQAVVKEVKKKAKAQENMRNLVDDSVSRIIQTRPEKPVSGNRKRTSNSSGSPIRREYSSVTRSESLSATRSDVPAVTTSESSFLIRNEFQMSLGCVLRSGDRNPAGQSVEEVVLQLKYMCRKKKKYRRFSGSQ